MEDKSGLKAKIAELNEWVDGPFKAYLQTLLDKAQRRTRKKLKFWQAMGTSFFDFDGENEYRRPGDPLDFMDMLERNLHEPDNELWTQHPELMEFLKLIYDLDEAFDNWIVGDMEPTVPPKGKKP